MVQMQDVMSKSIPEFREGSIVKGTILEIRPREVLVDIKYKSEGVISLAEFEDAANLEVGDEVDDHDFSTFEKVHAQRADIEGKVRARAMPPAGRPQLTETERRTLLAWIGCRAPEN